MGIWEKLRRRKKRRKGVSEFYFSEVAKMERFFSVKTSNVWRNRRLWFGLFSPLFFLSFLIFTLQDGDPVDVFEV